MDESLDRISGQLAEMQTRISKLEADARSAPIPPLRSRRQMLKLAGATVAGAAAAAAGIVGTAKPGLALTGDPILAGRSQNTLDGNVADKATQLDYTGTANVGAAFFAQAGTAFNAGVAAFPAALAGWSEHAAMKNGVYGYTNVDAGIGVVGVNDSNGNGGPGVLGQSRKGYAGQFAIFSTAKAQLFLVPNFASMGPPPPGGHQIGELYVDAGGVLYYFNNGAFRPIGGSAGGITTMLSSPIRLLETRTAYQDNTPGTGQTHPGVKLNNGETFDLPITGHVMNGISVPAGAKAVIGNVTVTGTTGGGYLTLFPLGAAQPNASSINYGAGATVANGVIVGLSAAGHMAIYCYASSDVIFDASGYIM